MESNVIQLLEKLLAKEKILDEIYRDYKIKCEKNPRRADKVHQDVGWKALSLLHEYEKIDREGRG